MGNTHLLIRASHSEIQQNVVFNLRTAKIRMFIPLARNSVLSSGINRDKAATVSKLQGDLTS